jgi:phage terminase small subunit
VAGGSRARSERAAWARAEAIVRMLSNWLAEHDIFSDEEAGEPRHKVLEQLSRFERLAAERRSELGLSPTAKAKLRKDLAAGTEDLAEAFAKLHGEDS